MIREDGRSKKEKKREEKKKGRGEGMVKWTRETKTTCKRVWKGEYVTKHKFKRVYTYAHQVKENSIQFCDGEL